MMGASPSMDGRRRRLSRWLVLLALAALVSLFGSSAIARLDSQEVQQPPAAQAPAAQPAAAQPSASKLRLVKAIAGTKSSEQDGRTAIADPRRTFYFPTDRQVTAYFEWEGPPGRHHFEGVWRNPQGRTTEPVGFDSEAKTERFGASWKLALSENTRPGVWTLEVRVDGKLAGSQKVNVITPRQPLRTLTGTYVAPAEMHRRALAATLAIEKLGSRGQVLETTSGFFGDNGLVFTAFRSLDGAKSVRLILPGGRQLETDEVLSWSRREDWAVLNVRIPDVPKLPRAKDNSWTVGQRCFYLKFDETNRIIVDTTIIHHETFPQVGERLELEQIPGPRAIGSALFNEYGEVIGVLNGLVPGSYSIAKERIAYATNVIDARRFLRDVMAVPISFVFTPAPSTVPTKLEELERRGEFVPPLEGQENVGHGTLAREMQQTGGTGGLPQPASANFDFTRLDGEAGIIVNWAPKQKIQGIVSLRVYDLDNRLLTENASTTMDGQPGYTYTSGWRFDVSRLAAGTYRVDVGVGNSVMWRSFFRILD